MLRFTVGFALAAVAALGQPASNPPEGDGPTPGAIAAPQQPTFVKVLPILGGVVLQKQPYIPLTSKERLDLWVSENVTTPGPYARALVSASFAHVRDSPPEWDKDANGYFKRLSSRYAQARVSSSIRHGVNAMLRHEPRYVICNCGSIGRRILHAAALNIFTYNSAGAPVVNVGRFVAPFGANSVAEVWLPGSGFDTWRMVRHGTREVIWGFGVNMLREFSPEIRRGLKAGTKGLIK